MASDNNSEFEPDALLERPLQPGAPGAAWPPRPERYAANPSAKNAAGKSSEPAPVPNCPHCNRKLLSVRSILCNWCGKRIDNDEYLERAAEQRAAEDARLRDQVNKELEETAKMGILGRLTGKRKAVKQRDPNLLLP